MLFVLQKFSVRVVTAEATTCTAWSRNANWVIALMPFYWRFMQCLRRYRDTREAFPHLVNAGKYFTAVIYTVIGLANRDRNGAFIICEGSPVVALERDRLVMIRRVKHAWKNRVTRGCFRMLCENLSFAPKAI